MDIITLITTASAAFAAVGGVEAAKFFIGRKEYRRKVDAEADAAELGVLKDTTGFLQVQLRDKEERFADQTKVVRELNAQVLELTKEKAQVELELQRYRCIRPRCAQREPQNGY